MHVDCNQELLDQELRQLRELEHQMPYEIILQTAYNIHWKRGFRDIAPVYYSS